MAKEVFEDCYGALVIASCKRQSHQTNCIRTCRLSYPGLLVCHSSLLGGARVTQWWEHSPPTNRARVQIPASKPLLCGLSLLLVLSLAPRGFSPGTPVFPSPEKPTFPNSNSTRIQVDEEPLCGCATCKSLFILLIYCFELLNCRSLITEIITSLF